jgi:hypothetical protein
MGSSVGIVIKLWAAQLGHGGLILGRSKIFIFLFSIGAHVASYTVGRAVTVVFCARGQVLSHAMRPCTAVLKLLTFSVAYYTRTVCQVSVLIFLWTNLKCSTLLRHTSA